MIFMLSASRGIETDSAWVLLLLGGSIMELSFLFLCTGVSDSLDCLRLYFWV